MALLQQTLCQQQTLPGLTGREDTKYATFAFVGLHGWCMHTHNTKGLLATKVRGLEMHGHYQTFVNRSKSATPSL